MFRPASLYFDILFAMRFAYSRWVGLLVGIFLFEIRCAAVESASLQDMLGAHLDRVMRKSGILPPTRHGEPTTNWFGRVVMEGEDALSAGLNYIQLRDSDLAARVREELHFPRDTQDEFRLPDIELLKEISYSQDTNEVAQIKAYVYEQFINFDPYAMIDRFEPYTMSFKIISVCGWFHSICDMMPRELPFSTEQCITVAKLADRYQPPELPPPQYEVESKIIRMNYALRRYQSSVKAALEPCVDALQRQLPKDEFSQLSNEVVRLTRMTSKREKDFFKRIVVRERSERAERERKSLRLPHYIVQPDGSLRRDPDDLKYPPEAFIHQ